MHKKNAINMQLDKIYLADPYLIERNTVLSPICKDVEKLYKIDVITISSVVNNALSRHGGTGHWFIFIIYTIIVYTFSY